MPLQDFCRRVVTISPEESVLEAAKVMKEKNLGSLVVAENNKPVGIITDRDITVRVVAEGKNPSEVKVKDVMTPNPQTLKGSMGLFEAIEKMKEVGVRRFPIVDDNGNVIGIITLDDVIYILGKEMEDITKVLEREAPKL